MDELNAISQEYSCSTLSLKRFCIRDTLLRCNTFFLNRDQLVEHLDSIGKGKPKYTDPPSNFE